MGWSGPRAKVAVAGRPAEAEITAGDYGDRIKIVLGDAVVEYEDGANEERETYTFYRGLDGLPADALASSIRKVLGIDDKKADLLGALLGCSHVKFSYAVANITSKRTGEELRVETYRLVEATRADASNFTDADVLAFLAGKTPMEVASGRGQFAGTPYVEALASRAKVMARFDGVALEDGKYVVKGEVR